MDCGSFFLMTQKLDSKFGYQWDSIFDIEWGFHRREIGGIMEYLLLKKRD